MDEQVKLRGYRIELGEIEQALLGYEGIRQAVAVVGKSLGREDQELAAYFVSENKQITTAELRKFLISRLPGYMIPVRFIQLEKIPLTINGKVDKKLLLNEQGPRLASGIAYEGPQNEVEKELAGMWQEHLGLARVGRIDDYFYLGGDSIKMIRLISIINKSFNIEFPIASFYKNPTIASISSFILQKADLPHIQDPVRGEINAFLQDLEASVLANHKFPDKIANVYPMSDIQTGMIVTAQIMQKNNQAGIYHDQFLFQLGLIDIPTLTSAMQLMVKKHETFRTSFHLYDFKKPVQIIHRSTPIHISFEDISGSENDRRESYIHQFLVDQRELNPFIVTEPRLWRINVFKINPTEVIFVFQFHHAILDGWSEKRFRLELFEIYNALETDSTSIPVPLQCSMRDSVISDMLELRNKDNINYWKNKVADYKRLDIFSGERIDNEVLKIYDQAFSDKILTKCKEDNIEPKSLFFSGYIYVLSMLTFEKDLTVGLVAHRRPIVEDGDKLMGCFLNSVPFRFDFSSSKGDSWIEFIRQIDSDLRDLKGKDRFSLNEISILAGERSPQNPFFDVLFNYVDFHVLYELYENDDFQSRESERELEDFSYRDFERANTFLDFTLSITGKRLMIKAMNSRALLSSHQLDDLLLYFTNFLQAYLHNSEAPIDNSIILSETERQNLIVGFNDTYSAYPKNKTLVDLFEEQVDKTPDATALVFSDTVLKYKELDELANSFVHYLLDKYSIQRSDLIAVKLERSNWVIVAILGVLKAGGAYLPIDSKYPNIRISYMEEDSHCKVCIDEALLSDFISQKFIWPISRVSLEQNSTDLAYVIYTSGSTGNPKGVMIEHGGIVNTILSMIDMFRIEKNSRCLQFASFSFDASIAEIFTALLSGSGLYMIGESLRNDPGSLELYIQDNKLDVATLPPAYLKLMDINKLKEMKVLITAGESPIYENVRDYLILGSGVYFNAYGPTEVSICGTIFEISDVEKLRSKQIPIGKPINNARVFILNKFDQLQPVNVVGEICIGGAGVARGYLNGAALTSEKFCANPFATGERLYKTGDLGKWLPDGNIVFFGRKDNQVKIRGHRIELGELENLLLQKEHISTAIALLIENESNEQKLALYYVSDQEETVTGLRRYLEERLPAYMLPDVYMPMEAMPLTSNGKVDKKALAVLKAMDVLSGVEYVAPIGSIEEKLVAIWQEVLKKMPIGVKDTFFEVGGNSIKAIQLISRIRKEFNIDLDVATLYHNATIEAIRIKIEDFSWINIHSEETQDNVERYSF
ncbi:MAG TPA: amino acid adenylation domain-containing protein [Puia sp.]|nr:amino acid adenylation domain-containing protein [Puia sp.]